jgi:hypothetical protein
LVGNSLSFVFLVSSSTTTSAFAPYKIELDDGRNIFAPGDMDQVIRRDPNAAAVAE